MSLFVAGTDTGVGKTVVSAILTLKLGIKYWKPVQSGLETDAKWVSQFVDAQNIVAEIYSLDLPLSPHEAARRQGLRIDLEKILMAVPRGAVIVEGAGGILTPLNETALMADLMSALALPIILVARSGLGTINHTLLTIEALRRRGLDLGGVVMVGPENPANLNAVEYYGKTTVLGTIPIVERFSRDELMRLGRFINLPKAPKELVI